MDLLLAVGSRRKNNPIIQQTILNAVNGLPVLRKADVDLEELCAICLNSFEAVFEEEVHYVWDRRRDLGLGEGSIEEEEGLILGLTKVEHCGHIFCRRDLAEWIRGFHGSCPTCRHPFLELPAESDDESSDGGEYIPEEEDEQDYFDLTDYSEIDALIPSEAEILEMNEIAQTRDDAEDEIEAMRRERTAAEIFSEGGSEEGSLPELEEDSHFAFFAEADEPLSAAPSLDWVAAAELATLGSRELISFGEEWMGQELEAEAEVGNETSRQLREVAELDAELAEDFASAVDYMGDESGSEVEDEGSICAFASDTVMDVVFSDSSSDLDYEPEDYMMNSDSEPSDSGYTSSDYGVDELAYLDQVDDPVAIHSESSSDSIFSLANVGVEKVPPSTDSTVHQTPGQASR